MISNFSGKRCFSETATGTPATASVGTPAATGQRIFITDIAASSDVAGSVLLVKDGVTVIHQQIVGARPYSHSFETPLIVTADVSASITIDGAADCRANIVGFIA